jgi:hypothetical protein
MLTQVRHLLMHLWPRAVPHPNAWRLSVARIVKYWHVFTGYKVIAVAGSHDSVPIHEVRAAFPPDCEIIEWPNNPRLREVATFWELMARVRERIGVTFYCHGKGSTHHDTSICQEWGDVMAETLLSDTRLIDKAFDSGYRMLGSFRRNGRFGRKPDNWHYSGTFYWFDNDAMFRAARSWNDVDDTWFGMESWPGKLFHNPQHCGCAFLDWCGDLYSERYWEQVVRPELEKWRARHELVIRPITDKCEFEPLHNSPGQNACVRCRKVVHDTLLFQEHVCSSGFRSVDSPVPQVCLHRGPRVRSVTCIECGGKTAPVFKCAVFGECLAHRLQGAAEFHTCAGCTSAKFLV